MKYMLRLLLAVFLLGSLAMDAQDGHKRRKRLFRKNSGGPSNPYIDRKARNKPSARMARENNHEVKRQKRKFRRDNRRARRATGYKKP